MHRSLAARTMGKNAGLSRETGGGALANGGRGLLLPRELARAPATRIELEEADWLPPVEKPEAVIYRVRSGVLAAGPGAGDNAAQVAEFYYPGDVILPAAANEQPLCLRAVSAATLDAWNLEAFRRHANGQACLSLALFELARDDLSRRLERSGRMRRLNVEARFATFLLEAAQRLDGASKGTASFSLPMSRNEIAGYLGLRTETLCRVIRRWRDEGLIALDGPRQIEIPDLDALRSLIEASLQGVVRPH